MISNILCNPGMQFHMLNDYVENICRLSTCLMECLNDTEKYANCKASLEMLLVLCLLIKRKSLRVRSLSAALSVQGYKQSHLCRKRARKGRDHDKCLFFRF